jgi:universal stress protein A
MKTKLIERGTGVAGLKVDRILVPLAFSETAHEALDYAVALATDMKAKIILMHVIEPVYVSADPGLTYLPQQTAAEKRAEGKQMRQIAADFIPKALFDKAVVCVGPPYHEITMAAKRLKAGLIVITTHGRTGLSHVLMGSTAERVVRHAPCPVLTVRRTQ